MTPHLARSELPSTADTELARVAHRELASLVDQAEGASLTVGIASETIRLPQQAVHLLQEILGLMADGQAVSLLPVPAELTTHQAAELLNVARPFLLGVLEAGQIPFHRVGTDRRILFRDLMAYQKATEDNRRAALDALVQESQQRGLGI